VYGSPRAGYWVVVDGGTVVGGAGFAQLVGGPEDVCELQKMYFLPAARGRGVGRQLIQQVLDAARRAGFARCYLETMDTMQAAMSLYARFEFARLDAPMGGTGHFSCNRWFIKDLS
jgi:GNAT superfamily N-acetyltransferase